MPPRKNYRMTNRKSYTTKRTSPTAKTTTKTTAKTTTSTQYACNSPRYNTPRTECQMRIGSYRNVYSQFTPTGQKTQFSPTNANKWTKYVTNGNIVYKFNTQQFTRFFGTKWAQSSPTTCKQWMKKKFGTGIKDVTRGKGNTWLVATTKNVTGRPFNNYNWK